jgi:hypothetical protein
MGTVHHSYLNLNESNLKVIETKKKSYEQYCANDVCVIMNKYTREHNGNCIVKDMNLYGIRIMTNIE